MSCPIASENQIPVAGKGVETVWWRRPESQSKLFTSLARSVLMLVALNVMEDDVTQKLGQSGACQIHARKFGTSRPDILTVGCEELCREATEHG